MRSARIRRENTLKALYHILENGGFHGDTVELTELARHTGETLKEVQSRVRALLSAGFVSVKGDSVTLETQGWKRAGEIVRNHRLWELYLTHAASIAADHVHEDAEKIEHMLGEEIVAKLERRLNYARRDPHGRLIPGLGDLGLAVHGLTVRPPATKAPNGTDGTGP